MQTFIIHKHQKLKQSPFSVYAVSLLAAVWPNSDPKEELFLQMT